MQCIDPGVYIGEKGDFSKRIGRVSQENRRHFPGNIVHSIYRKTKTTTETVKIGTETD